jgi:hypothetical protein
LSIDQPIVTFEVSKVAKIDDQTILKRAKELCNEAGIAWDWFDTAASGARVLDSAGRRECLMRARQQLINQIGDVVPESFKEEPRDRVDTVMTAADRPTLSTPPPSPSDRIRDNAA